MAKIRSTDELPKWFDINNYYPQLTALSEESLAHQLRVRVRLLPNYHHRNFNYTKHEDYKLISSSKPILPDIFESLNQSELERVTSKYRDVYAYGDSVRLASLGDLILAGQRAKNILENIEEDGRSDAVIWLYLKSLSYDLLDYEAGQASELLINVQLQYSDEEIINELAENLPKFRAKLQVEHPKKPVHSIQYYLRKVLAYRLIPVMDLLLWAQVNDKIIPNHILALKIGPKGEIGETTIARNSIPLINELMSLDSEARGVVLNQTLQKN